MQAKSDCSSLDVRPLAGSDAVREGHCDIRQFQRLLAGAQPVLSAPQVQWRLRGAQRAGVDGVQRPALQLQARAQLQLRCQRCLAAVDVPLQVDRFFVLAADEDQAARLDEELEDDVLAGAEAVLLGTLLEDELILAVPLVPRHQQCEMPAGADAAPDEDQGNMQRPFADLKAMLQRSGR